MTTIDVNCFVFLGGKGLKGKSAHELANVIKKCSIVKPKNILKKQKVAGFCLIEFENNQEASKFYYYYIKENYRLCIAFSPLFIKPAKLKDGPTATYFDANI